MSEPQTFYVGTAAEVAHHAEPLVKPLGVRMAQPDQVLRWSRPGDLAIFYSEHFDRFRHTCRQLKSRDVATLYAIDGILEWRNAWENRPDEPACPWTMRPVLSHKVACIGRSQQRVLDDWGNAARTEVVGLPRLDLFQFERRASAGAIQVLVTTAKCPGFTDEQVSAAERALRDLKRWFEAHPVIAGRPVHVLWRLAADLDRRLEVTSQFGDVTGRELAAMLGIVDAVITTPSTVALEAMLADLPVAILDYTNSPRYVDAAWWITAAEHIGPVVQQLAGGDPRRMLYQRSALRDALEGDGRATERMVQLCRRMHHSAAECLAGRRPLSFPPHMLPDARPAASTSPLLEHCQVYPEFFAEFRCGDASVQAADGVALELQAELAHARREIEHLHQCITQLKSELSHAHAIFDRVHRHPIAGPVVRTGQRLAALMGPRGSQPAAEQPGGAIDAATALRPPAPSPGAPASRLISPPNPATSSTDAQR